MISTKTAARFTVLTFVIMLIGWGSCLAFAQAGVSLDRQAWLYAPYLLGGFSPTIASYLVLKKDKAVTGFGDWLKQVFDPRAKPGAYLFTVCIVAALFIAQALLSGLTQKQPFSMFFAMLPAMVIGGGLEEAGWRYVLQPVLDRKYGYILSSLAVAVIWALWHLPLFYIPGTGQYGTSFGLFAISTFALTFVLGAVSKLSGKVLPCILAHSMVNAGFEVFSAKQTLPGNLAAAGIVIAICAAAVLVWKKKGTGRVIL